MGCHIIILTDKYYVEANTEILFTKPFGIPINRDVGRGEEFAAALHPLFTHSSPIYFYTSTHKGGYTSSYRFWVQVKSGEERVKSCWWLFTSRNADKHRGFGRKGEEWRDFCRMLNINHIDRIGKSGFPVWDDCLIGTAYCSLFRQLAVRPKQPTGHTQTAHLSFGDKYQNIGDLSAKNSHIKTKTKWNFPEIWRV